jgi:hypothetical protein
MQKNRKIAGDKLVGGNISSRWATVLNSLINSKGLKSYI